MQRLVALDCHQGGVGVQVPPFPLSQHYQTAWSAYQANWQHVDNELIKLVAAHATATFVDIHLRVVFMNGVYRAQLNRTIGSNADYRAAQALAANWKTVTSAMAPLAGFTGPTPAAMAAVVAAHDAIVKVLQGAFPGSNKTTSFASKFLWPEAPDLVPIFDSYTDKHARRDRLGYAAAIGGVRAAMGTPPHSGSAYFDHVARYMATHQTLAALGLPPNVPLKMKGIDHMYWLGQEGEQSVRAAAL